MKIRTFVAFELSEDVRQRISKFLFQLRELEGRVKWVAPDHVHLTLKFLGEIEEEKIQPIMNTLSGIAERFEPFEVMVKGTGVFPDIKNPRVIWVGVIDQSGNLERIHRSIDQGMHTYGIPMEQRRFVPHITLGRVKDKAKVDRLLRTIEERKSEEFGQWMIKALTLFKSQLRPEGPIYTHLGIFPLVSK